MYSGISDAVENNMEEFTKKLYSKQTITKAARKSHNYSQVTDDFWAYLSLTNSIQDIETHCLDFIESLQAIGGAASLAADTLGRKWQEDVNKELAISFLSSYSGTSSN